MLSALSLLLFVGLAIFAAWALRGLSQEFQDWSHVRDWNPRFYRPMSSLLASDDYQFLHNQKHATDRMRSEFRADRRRVFRSYMRALRRDVALMQRAAWAGILLSGMDVRQPAYALLRQRAVFQVAMLGLEARLALHWMGLDTELSVEAVVAPAAALRQMGLAATAA